MNADHPVVATAQDAASCKLSAVKHGYYDDAYLHALDLPHHRKKPTIINRGTYARTKSVEYIVRAFLEMGKVAMEGQATEEDGAGSAYQLVLLGAGRDSLFFRLAEEGLRPSLCLEVDVESIIDPKVRFISTSASHVSVLGHEHIGDDPVSPKRGLHEVAEGVSVWRHGCLAMGSADLAKPAQLQLLAEKEGLDPTVPTLFLAECVLAYMQPGEVDSLVQWCADYSPGGGVFVAYDMIEPNDPFGRMMVQNLGMNGLRLDGLRACPTRGDQKDRYLSNGWGACESCTMLSVFDDFTCAPEKERVAKIEWLDELEEWNLIMSHYCITVAGAGAFAGFADEQLGAPFGVGEAHIPLLHPAGPRETSPRPSLASVTEEAANLHEGQHVSAVHAVHERPMLQHFDSADWSAGMASGTRPPHALPAASPNTAAAAAASNVASFLEGTKIDSPSPESQSAFGFAEGVPPVSDATTIGFKEAAARRLRFGGQRFDSADHFKKKGQAGRVAELSGVGKVPAPGKFAVASSSPLAAQLVADEYQSDGSNMSSPKGMGSPTNEQSAGHFSGAT